MDSNSYTTSYNDAGMHTVTVTVSDGTLTDSQDVTVTVNDANRAPVLDPISDITVNEGDIVSFSPTATDPDGNDLTYTYSSAGDWMTSNSYTTSYNDAGIHTVTVTVSDGTLTDSQDVTVTVNDVSQLVISNLKVASSKTYQIVDNGLQKGAKAYVDRKYKYSTVPASLQGSTYIMTANNDKRAKAASFLSFVVNQDVTVYVAHDDRITTKPSWLGSFADTGDNLVTTDTPLSVFVRNYPAGTITLGGNKGSRGNSMYTVVIVGQ
jgi:PKD repeat protein